MTNFEEFLINKGYKKYVVKRHLGKIILKKPKKHIISTMVNLDHRYYLEEVEGEDIHQLRNQIQPIIFGLHERNKPPTLIYPRPNVRMNVTFNKQTFNVVTSIYGDDSMNKIFKNFSNEKIFEGMFNKNIIFEI
jgi:hypothetical protein